MRRAAKRDDNEREITDALDAMRVQWWKIDSDEGVPDLLFCHQNRFGLIEVKDGSKEPARRRLTKGQQEFFDRTAGAPRYKVESVEQVVRCLQEFRSRAQ